MPLGHLMWTPQALLDLDLITVVLELYFVSYHAVSSHSIVWVSILVFSKAISSELDTEDNFGFTNVSYLVSLESL